MTPTQKAELQELLKAGLQACGFSGGCWRTPLIFGGISKKGSWIVRYLLGQADNIAARYDPQLKSFSKRLGQAESRRENGGGAQVGGQTGVDVARQH